MKLFPTHIRLILDADEQTALDTLWDELGARMVDELELIHRALREGIKVLNREVEAQRKNPDRPPTRTQLEAQNSVEKKARRLSSESAVVENYVATPINGEMRKRLESYLVRHPEMSEEDAIQHLLDVGLRSGEGDKQTTLERAARRARIGILRGLAR
jgi:hypothetical protein